MKPAFAMAEVANPPNGMQLLIDGRHQLGEGVLWCERTARLFWTDIPAATLWCYTPNTGLTQQWPLAEPLASFAFTADDDCLLLGLASQLAFLRLSTGAVTPICSVEAHLPTTRINDGRCDRQGRFVFGTFNQAPGHAPIGSFYRLNLDLKLERLPLPSVAIANSICFSPAGTVMYYCDSAARRIECCDLDPITGALSNQRIFATLDPASGEPDGSVIDADGYLWNAGWGGYRVVRYAPDGSVERIVAVPVQQPSCVAFGGADLSSLYVTSARIGLAQSLLDERPASGGLFHARFADVRGLPADRFAGAVPD